jgi:hypothetical protein
MCTFSILRLTMSGLRTRKRASNITDLVLFARNRFLAKGAAELLHNHERQESSQGSC